MAVLVDEPRWPAHGRLWAHLVSDTSLAELHAFARANGVPARSFDADHYDVPEAMVAELVAAGATQVTPRELLTRLVAAGLRVRQRDKPASKDPSAPSPPSGTVGIVLAAGAGTRYGGPKALVVGADGVPWLHARVAALAGAGCTPVLVVLGAQAPTAAALVPAQARVVVADDWAEGMSASLRAGLRAAAALEPAPAAALVALLDVPGLTDAAVARVLRAGAEHRAGRPSSDQAGGSARDATAVLARATYGGRPGHPVLLGRAHWSAASAAARGDRGAGPYLKAAGAALVECGDVADGRDVDRPPTLDR